MAKAMIIVDTCIWVPFFNRPQSVAKQYVDQLIDDDAVVMLGPILAEILQGFKREQQADWVASELRHLQFVNVEWDDWKQAAALGRKLVEQGHRLPLSDLIIGAIALRHQFKICTTDPHFQLIQGISVFAPGN